MSCSQCKGIEEQFDQKAAEGDLKGYRKNGVGKVTGWLLKTLEEKGVEGMSLLDIGGGVGMIQHQLLKAGASRAMHIDASNAYLETAKEEAQRRGLSEQITFQFGDFVELAPEIEPTDIVTLDKVICCYDDMQALVKKSSHLARKYYGVIFPKDVWWVKFAFNTLNFFLGFRSNPFRVFIHPTDEIEKIVKSSGLKRAAHRNGVLWQMMVFVR